MARKVIVKDKSKGKSSNILEETVVEPVDMGELAEPKSAEKFNDGVELMVDTGEYGDEDLDYCSSPPKGASLDDEEMPEVRLGASANDELMEENAQLRKLVFKFFDEREQMKQSQNQKSSDPIPSMSKATHGASGKEVQTAQVNTGGNVASKLTPVKSPSDTTIYAPALKKLGAKKLPLSCGVLQGIINEEGCNVNERNIDNELLQQVSDFVENIRVENQHRRANSCDRSQNFSNATRRIVQPPPANLELENARACNEQEIVNAERHRVGAEIPGMSNFETSNLQVGGNVDCGQNLMHEQGDEPCVPNLMNPTLVNQSNIPNIGSGVSDDDFFHLICYIDPALIHKIEKGEFVELDKSLPRNRNSNGNFRNDEDRFEWVQRDGGTFLVPAARDNRITGIRKWEQAIRVYATIYCGANPHRLKEIWQYISVINTAAASYAWDNVYNYDITFRHLMAFNPNRSWAVCYNQMWNLSMRDPLPKNKTGSNSNGTQWPSHARQNRNGNGNGQPQPSTSGTSNGKKRPDYCWNFNKGVKFGARCRFIERCSYCDSPNHGVNACPKAKDKEESKK